MKKSHKYLIDAIAALDPTEAKAVAKISLVRANGVVFMAKDVTVADGMVFARHCLDVNQWFYVPTDEIVGLIVDIDPKKCAEMKIEPTLPAVLAHALSR
jgi:hypothetical protein